MDLNQFDETKSICKIYILFRHDCQDGSDEFACDYSYLSVNRRFL